MNPTVEEPKDSCYGNYDIPSSHCQWNENAGHNTVAKIWTKEEILAFKTLLALSYKCNESEIDFDFEQITDKDNPSSELCLRLIYKVNTAKGWKRINEFLVLIPERLRVKVEENKKLRIGELTYPNAKP